MTGLRSKLLRMRGVLELRMRVKWRYPIFGNVLGARISRINSLLQDLDEGYLDACDEHIKYCEGKLDHFSNTQKKLERWRERCR